MPEEDRITNEIDAPATNFGPVSKGCLCEGRNDTSVFFTLAIPSKGFQLWFREDMG